MISSFNVWKATDKRLLTYSIALQVTHYGINSPHFNHGLVHEEITHSLTHEYLMD